MLSWFGNNQQQQRGIDHANKFSLTRMRGIYNRLVSSDLANKDNHDVVVELIREIAEMVVYGDQNVQSLFDYFAEKNVLSLFLAILRNPYSSKKVKIQIIQTISILIQSVKSETSLYYMLSKNHINEVILFPFDIADEEILAHYISFLKTIALKLNENTIHLFFNDNSFPLYTEAIKYFDSNDGMVRPSVWTITMKVYSIENTAVREFVFNGPPSHYFEKLVSHVCHQSYSLYFTMLNLLSCFGKRDDRPNLKQCISQIEQRIIRLQDELSYIQDMLDMDIKDLEDILGQTCMAFLYLPLYLPSLLNGEPFTKLADVSADYMQGVATEEIVSLYHTNETSAFIGLVLLSMSLFSMKNESMGKSLVGAIFNLKIQGETLNPIRNMVFNHLASQDNRVCLGASVLLYSVIKCNCVSEETLNNIGLLPARCNLKQNQSTGSISLLDSDEVNENINGLEINHNVRIDQTVIQESIKEKKTVSLNHESNIVEEYPVAVVDILIDQLRQKELACSLTTRVIAKLIIELVVSENGNGLNALHSIELAKIYCAAVDRVLELKSSTSPTRFLLLFEGEWEELKKGPLRVENVVTRPEIFLPLLTKDISGLTTNYPLDCRAPISPDEQISYAIREFILIRLLRTTLLGSPDPALVNLGSGGTHIKEGKKIDLSSCEYLPVNVFWDNKRFGSAYLVLVAGAVVLVEPHAGLLGQGITKSVAPLHRTDALRDTHDTRILHLRIKMKKKIGGSTSRIPAGIPIQHRKTNLCQGTWFLTLQFSSIHNCLWAKQELGKARIQARDQKLLKLSQMFQDDLYLEAENVDNNTMEKSKDNDVVSNEETSTSELDTDTAAESSKSNEVEKSGHERTTSMDVRESCTVANQNMDDVENPMGNTRNMQESLNVDSHSAVDVEQTNSLPSIEEVAKEKSTAIRDVSSPINGIVNGNDESITTVSPATEETSKANDEPITTVSPATKEISKGNDEPITTVSPATKEISKGNDEPITTVSPATTDTSMNDNENEARTDNRNKSHNIHAHPLLTEENQSKAEHAKQDITNSDHHVPSPQPLDEMTR